jgi:branched-chain amino acid aminotransferase
VQADELMEKEGYYEVLLVDHKGKVTEGSRSNVFFVAGNLLITPPGKEVLLGITRQKTIQLAAQMNIPYIEKEVFFDDINTYDAVFITGTSPKILPLSHISGREFNAQNKVVQLLLQEYEKLIRQYVSSRRV